MPDSKHVARNAHSPAADRARWDSHHRSARGERRPSAGARAARDRADGRLFEEHRRTADPRLRDTLIERHMPLARSLAGRYRGRGESHDDLVQVAAMALTCAVDRFDPGRGAAFASFAVPTILGELRRHFRDRGWAVRPPRGLLELALRVEHCTDHLSAHLGRPPGTRQIARAAGVSEEDVHDAQRARAGYHALSLSRAADDDPDGPTVQDRLGHTDDGFDHAEARALLRRLQSGLTARQQLAVKLRYEHDLTQAEIGERLGVSQMEVSRILRQALERLRAMALPDPARAGARGLRA